MRLIAALFAECPTEACCAVRPSERVENGGRDRAGSKASDQKQGSDEAGARGEQSRPKLMGRRSAAPMSYDRRPELLLPTIGILLCAATSTPAQAHGPDGNSFLLVAVLLIALPIVSSAADRFALKRWLAIELTTTAAAIANLAAVIVAVLVVTWFYDLIGMITGALEPARLNAAYVLRDYSAYLRLFIAALALVLTKALVLRWYALFPLTLRSSGVLFFSTLAAIGGVIGLTALSTWLLF
jgi:hypothetical protein